MEPEKKENNQKIKLLKIIEMLTMETDETHPLKTGEICDKLRAMNITCDRRTLGKDMRFLNEHGYEIMSYLDGHENAYYIADRSFSIPELRILIDAVQAASFITDKKTDLFIDKVAALGGSHRADILKKNIVNFNTHKHTNETVFYTVDCLGEAIQNRKKVSFRYFRLNEKGERVFDEDDYRRTVQPLALIFYEDNYYLMCWSDKYSKVFQYRIDRITEATVMEEAIGREALRQLEHFNADDYTEQVFKMFNGEPKYVTLEFPEELCGVVFDKFGEDLTMRKKAAGKIETKVKIYVSTTFFGWLSQFTGQMKILNPDPVREQYRQYLEKNLAEV